MKNFRKRCKRAVAGLLSVAMLSAFSAETFAMGENIEAAEENALEQELYVSNEYAKEHPNGVFTFKDLKIQANEDDGTTEITVVRKGGTEGKASVKFKAVDITTLYGIDYDIEVKEGLFKNKLEPNPEMEPLINQYIDEDNYVAKPEDEILSDAAAYIELANDLEEASNQDNTEETSVEETEDISIEETTVAENEDTVLAEEGKANGSNLRSAYAIYTGSNPKKNDWRNATAEKMDEESMALLPENMAETMKTLQSAIPGVEYTLDFDEGEYAKKLIVNIKDNEIYKGDIQFMFMLTDNEGAELSNDNSGYINIVDNDTVEKSLFQITNINQYVDMDEDSVKVTVTRVRGNDHIDTINIATEDDTAKAGIDYIANKTQLVFIGGVSERTFEVKLNKNRKYGDSFYVVLDNAYNTVDKGTGRVKITFGKENENSVALFSANEVSNLEKAASSEYKALDIKANVNSKNSGANGSANFNESMVSKVVVYYNYNVGTKNCKKMDYGGSGKILVNGQEYSLNLRDSGSSSITAEIQNGRLSSIGCKASTSDKNTNYKINITGVSIFRGTGTINIKNGASANNCYSPRVWAAVENTPLFTKGLTTYVADESEKVDGITRYYNYKDPKNNYSNENTRISKLIFAKNSGNDSSSFAHNETLNFADSFQNGWNSNSAYLYDVRIVKDNNVKSLGPVKKIVFNEDFFDTYGDYINTSNSANPVVNIVPVYRPKIAYVYANNVESDKGGFSGLNGSNNVFRVSMNDSVVLQGYGTGGYHNNGMAVSQNKPAGGDDELKIALDKNTTIAKDSATGGPVIGSVDFDPISYSQGWINSGTVTVNKDNIPDGYSYSEDSITSVMFPVTSRYVDVVPTYGDTRLRFLLHPSYPQYKDNVAVFYTGDDGTVENSEDGKLNINNPTMGKKYVAQTLMSTVKSGTIDYKDDSDKNNDDYENKEIKLLKEDGSVFESVMTDYTGVFNFTTLDTLDSSKTYNYFVSFELNDNKAVAPVTIKNNRLTKSTAFTIDKDGSITYEQTDLDYKNYMMRWIDGTYSSDINGSRTNEQTTFVKKLGIDIDTVYYGNLFSYVFDKYYDSKVYYEIMVKDDSKYTNSGKFSGKITYREKELFTNKVIVTPANGALVTIDVNDVSTDENGYFEYVYDKGYHQYEDYGMLISYRDINYADSIRPWGEKEFQLDSEKVVSVSNGSITKNGKEIKYTDMGFDNSDCQMKITAEVQSNNQLVVPQKAVITAYTYGGIPIGTNEVTINNNSLSYEFNPGKYKAGDTAEEITLPQGATFTIKVIDQNGAEYGEFKTGLSVNQSVDEIGINASITPPFGTVDLLGNTSMHIDPSVTAKGEDAPNSSYKLTDDEARSFTEDTVLPYDFDTKSAPTVKAAATPGDNPDVDGFIGSDYVVFNLGFDFSGNPSDGRTPLEKDAPLREKLLDSFKNNNFKLALDKFNMTKEKLQDEHGNFKNKSTAMNTNFSFDVSMFCRIGFLRDKNGNMYFADAALTEYAGISGNFSFQAYYVIPFVVDAGCTLAFTGTQLWIAKPSKDSENTVKLGTINTGELLKKTDNLSGPGSYHYYNVGLSFSVELYGGIGIACMKIQIGGQAVFGYDYSSYFYEPDESENDLGNKKIDEKINTGYIDLTAKARLKLVIFSTELNIAHKRWTWDDKNGSKTDALSLFNGTMPLANSAEAFKPADSSFKLDDVSYLDDRKGWLGGQKSKLLRLADNNGNIGFDESTLIDKVYEDAEPKLINLDNGKYLLLYLDAINGSTDIGLHYSVFDGSNWSKPQLVCDDCITSHKPSVYDLGDRVAVAWANASTTNDNAVAESLNSMNIKLAFFDKNSQVFSDCLDVTKETVNDAFSDNYPVISRGIRNGRDTLIIYYYKSAYNEENTVVGDMINPETFMVCRFFDLESNEFIDNYSDDEKNDIVSGSPSIDIDNYEKQWYGQRFINLSPKVQVNEASVLNADGTWKAQAKFAPATTSAYANIIDYCVEDYDNKTVIAYILDEDDNYQTTNDRQVYIQIYYYNEDRYSDAIKVSGTETECYCPTMLKLNNTLYLAWADEAGIECTDLGNIIKNCIEEVNVDGITTEVINKQQDGYYQAPTLLIPNDENSNIYDFVVQTDNQDVAYIGWVKSETVIKDGIDPESDEAMLNENRIAESAVYIARYTADNDRLSIPVKMTDENAANYSQIVFDVTDDNKVKAVATKAYSEIISQGTGENGEPAEYVGESGKSRSLVTMDFDVVKDINIIDSSIENVVYGDTPYANINIKNEGFVDAENLKLIVNDNDDGTVLAEQEGISLRSGESYTASLTLNQITNSGDYDVNITLYNETGDILDEVYKDAEIASKVVIDITDETYLNRDTLLLNFKAVNEGNYPSEKTDVNVYCREDKVLENAATIGELAPGESVNGSVTIELTPDMFANDDSYTDGYKETAEISLTTKDSADSVVEEREVTLDQIAAFGNTSKLNSSYDNTVKVGVGQDIDLNLSTDSDSSNIKFVAYSQDNSIARAYDMGVITGIQKGSTQVTVYAIPYCDRIILSENGRYEAVDLESVPEKYMVKKTFNVEVVDDEQPISEPTSDPTTETTTEATETTTKARSSGGGSGAGVSKQSITTTEAVTETTTLSTDDITEVTTNASADNVPFNDIKSKWYENAVSKLYNLGIAAGVSDTEFAPDINIRRGDFIMLIMNMLGDKVNTDIKHNDFSDVAKDSYYHDNIIKARNCGIAYGFGDNSFKPDEFITREEMFSFTARALKLMNMLEDSNNELRFTDKADISPYAVEDITKLYSMGIVNGFADNTILPKANTTRAEAAQVVYNVIERISAK